MPTLNLSNSHSSTGDYFLVACVSKRRPAYSHMQYQLARITVKLMHAKHNTPDTVLNDHIYKTTLAIAFDQMFAAAAKGTDMPAKLLPFFGA